MVYYHAGRTLTQIETLLKKAYGNPLPTIPHGRITFISKDGGKSGTFKLMAGKKILVQAFYVQKLKEIYNIDTRYKLDILHDSHYRTK